ncbi:MAG: class I SAM-dependent methyltransferase [Chloracidobacterium sp.]|nr:class I SAM-dependent methyltransferase [Chloracidobacterium sp.]MDW8218834.1 class I SAM-dependent methyltransferase [Acidobacteriota bacterium]
MLSEVDGKTGRPLMTALCLRCAVAQVTPRPDAETLHTFYAQAYREAYKGVHRPKKKHIVRAARSARERLDWLAPWLLPGARLLDIGAGGGEFVAVARARGFDAEGVEPHAGYAAYARAAYAAPLVSAPLDALEPQPVFDLVTAFHVLEHLRDPVAALRRMAAWLSPQGRLAIEVPNLLYPYAAPHNTFFAAHLFHFTPETLATVAARAGLEALQVQAAGDGAVIRAVFRPGASTVAPPPAGLAAEIMALYARRTWRRYLSSPRVWRKLPSRLRRIAEEAFWSTYCRQAQDVIRQFA